MAETLGYASVSAMLKEVSSPEITEWKAYFKQKEIYEKEAAAQAKNK